MDRQFNGEHERKKETISNGQQRKNISSSYSTSDTRR